MKWSLILRLSFVELVLAVASIFFISPNAEIILWLASVVLFAYVIGNGTRQYRFLHGLLLGILNGVWVSLAHSIFLSRYLAAHPRAIASIDAIHSAGLAASPRFIMSFTGTLVGILEGIVIGIFAVVAGLMVRPRRMDLSAEPEILEH